MSKQRTVTGRRTDSRRGDASRPARRPVVVENIWEPSNIMMAGVFILLVMIFFWGHLTGGAFLWEDFTEAFFPYQHFAAANIASGTIPFWNPYTFNGMPFMADLQNGLFYPGNQLMYLLSGGNLSAWLAQFFIILHYLVALLGMWKLARGFGLGQWGSALAAIGYAFSALMVTHAMHHNMIYHEAWFPLIVHFFHRGITQRSLFHSLAAGLLLGIMLLGGHPQMALYVVFFLFCLTIFLFVREMRAGEERATGRSIAGGALVAALPVVIGAGLFAIQLLPGMELAGLSERAAFTYEQTLEGALGMGQLITLIVPKFFGVAGPAAAADMQFWYRPQPHYFWETAIYIGVVTLILAAIGLASNRLGALRWFLAGMGVFGLLYALGDSFFVHPIIGRLPLFSTFRIPTRMTLYLTLGGALLAGAGLDRLLRGGEDADRLRRIVLAAGGVVVLIGLLAVSGALLAPFDAPPGVGEHTASTGIAALLIGAAVTAVVWGRLRGNVPGAAAGGLVVLLAVIDMFVFGMGLNDSPVNPQTEIYDRNDAQFAAFKSDPPGKLFRVKMREGGFMLMPRNQGPYSGIMLYEGYNALLLQRRVPPVTPQDRAFDLLDIQYDVSIDPGTQAAGLVQRPTALPHARMVYDAKVVDSAGAYNLLKNGQVDLASTVVLEKDPGITLDATGRGTATVTHYDAADITVDVRTDKPGILVLSEIWYPAWKAYVDGNPAELLIADYSLRGIAVPAGTHTVELRFESGAFATGLWITLVTLVAAVGGLIFVRMRRRGAAAEAPDAADAA